MVLVAIAMVAIIAMAALSIDVITLYLAREEAQRAADAGALAAARVISISGVTGTAGPDSDSGAWTTICGGNTSVASLTAKAAAQENSVAGSAANVTVTYSSGSGPDLPLADCTAVTLDDQLGVNPLVTVKVERDSLPTLFSRIWSRATNTVSATATAEAFNPSNSGSFAPGGDAVPVTPRCVKPWIIPNKDPKNGGRLFVDKRTGEIQTLGVRVNGAGTGIVGESFTLTDSCSRSDCSNMVGQVPAPGAYIPALVTQPAIAVPSCADDSDYQKAIGGCDQSTVYACGTVGGSTADLTINPGGATGDTSLAAQCLIHQSGGLGQDTLDVAAFPFQIKAGSANPIISSTTQVITASNSIVTLPIYDDSIGRLPSSKPTITVIGFLQVFIDSVTANGNLNVHVLNVAGCGNDASTTLSAPGTSPVPIRLITRQ